MEKYKQIVFWAARIILAGVFVNASVSKIARPDEFYTAIMNYQILPQYLAYVLSYFLPVLELVCSIALLLNVFLGGAQPHGDLVQPVRRDERGNRPKRRRPQGH